MRHLELNFSGIMSCFFFEINDTPHLHKTAVYPGPIASRLLGDSSLKCKQHYTK